MLDVADAEKTDTSESEEVHGPSIVRNLAYPAIDGLRAYAALMVFVVHATTMIAQSITKMALPTYLPEPKFGLPQLVLWLGDGQHGVDIFFVISGFLMSRMVLAPRKFSYARFLWKRFARIYPAFFVSMLAAVFVYCYWYHTPFYWWSFIGNLLFLNSFNQLGLQVYNYPTWSLGYEAAFYLVIPILLIFRRAMGAARAPALLTIVAILLVPDQFIRMRGLFIGGLLGSLQDAELAALGRFAPMPVLLIVYFGLTMLHDTYVISYAPFYNMMIVTIALLFARIVFNSGVIHRFFCLRVMRSIGTISYSFYLLHAIVLALVLSAIMPWAGLTGTIASQIVWFIGLSLSGTLVVAWISYMMFERPYFALRRAARPTTS